MVPRPVVIAPNTLALGRDRREGAALGDGSWSENGNTRSTMGLIPNWSGALSHAQKHPR
jgi:hypothetical protein